MPKSTWAKSRLKRFAALCALCIALVLLYKIFRVGVPCLFYHVTSLYCGGCGSMRALDALLHFSFYQALRFNAAMVALLPLLAYVLVQEAIATFRDIPRKIGKVESAVLLCAGISLFVFGILRNLPLFSFLAPISL